MYVVTFYSFKGGVGRTMTLVNVGVALAARGRRVLLVDFDLEAPGIPTFELFSAVTETAGVVDLRIVRRRPGHAARGAPGARARRRNIRGRRHGQGILTGPV